MRRHHRYNLRSTAADSSDSSDEEEKDAGCPGCRRTAPYYATKLLSPDADGKDREALVQKLRSSPFFQGVITREHPFYPKIEANTPLPAGISIVAIYQRLMGNYHSLHYFILINLRGGRLICIDSWNDGTRRRNLEIRCWTGEDAAALIALTSIQNHEIYNAIITQLFNVTLPRPFDDRHPLVIEYLSYAAIAELIGHSGDERTELLISEILKYCATGQTLESFFTT
jgi:hypothetical protein